MSLTQKPLSPFAAEASGIDIAQPLSADEVRAIEAATDEHAVLVDGEVAEGRILLMDLLEHATQRERVYRHRWQVGGLVIWDNTATLHRGRHFDFAERRELRRATTQEVVRPAAVRAA